MPEMLNCPFCNKAPGWHDFNIEAGKPNAERNYFCCGVSCDESKWNIYVKAVEAQSNKPRVLIIVSGGVADYVADEGVEVEGFDWDNYNSDPEYTLLPPAHFKDLAEPCGIPVEAE